MEIHAVFRRHLPRVQTGNEQQLIHQRAHLFAFIQHLRNRFVLFIDILSGERVFAQRAHAVERRAQLVRSVAGKPALMIKGRFQAGKHLLQRVRQRMQFIAPGAVSRQRISGRKIAAARNAGRRLRHLPHRAQRTAGEQIAAGKRKQHKPRNQQKFKTQNALRDAIGKLCRGMQPEPDRLKPGQINQRIQNHPVITSLLNGPHRIRLKGRFHPLAAINQIACLIKERCIYIGHLVDIRIDLNDAVLDFHLIHDHKCCASERFTAEALLRAPGLHEKKEHHQRADHQHQRRIPQRDAHFDRHSAFHASSRRT